MTTSSATAGTPRPPGTDATRDEGRSRRWPTSERVVPVWVHRLHGDGLPGAEGSAQVPRRPGSQRFVERWGGVTAGH